MEEGAQKLPHGGPSGKPCLGPHGPPLTLRLPAALRARMEQAFGCDFSDVRIHTESPRAVALGALAYTQGNDIHVAPGHWTPELRRGQHLLAHELWHVVQQRSGRVWATRTLAGAELNEDPLLEAEAEWMAAWAMRGGRLRSGAGGACLGPGTPVLLPSGPLPIQRIKITTTFDPKHPGRRKPATVETDLYTPEELLEMFISSLNKPYLSSSSNSGGPAFLNLALELDRRLGRMGWVEQFHEGRHDLLKDAQKNFTTLGLIPNPVTEAAVEYLGLLSAMLDSPDHRAYVDPDRGFVAKAIAGGRGDPKGEIAKKLAVRNSECRKEKALRLRYETQREGQALLQLGAYFAAEITDPAARERFLEFLATKATVLKLHEEEPPTLPESFLPTLHTEIRQKAIEEVAKANTRKSGTIATTFEQSLPKNLQAKINGLRQRIQLVLEPFTVLIQDLFPGSQLRYRGSLTDGIKNFTKSKALTTTSPTHDFGKKAISVNIEAFDVDAFVEIPEGLWKKWEEANIIPDRKHQAIKGKIKLEDWIPMLELLSSRHNIAAYLELPKIKQLRQLERILQQELRLFDGYKQNLESALAEFEMVLQPQSKTKSAEVYGKPYPRGELSRGGSAFQELTATFKQLKEEGIDTPGAFLKETTLTITPRYNSVSRAKAIIQNGWRRLKVIDLRGLDVSSTDLETLITAIEDGKLPFLTNLSVDAVLTSAQQQRIRAVLPVHLRFVDNTSLNF